jgi:hypothetical protein
MKALAGGSQGFAYLSRVLSVLLQTLLQDEIAEVTLTFIFATISSTRNSLYS